MFNTTIIFKVHGRFTSNGVAHWNCRAHCNEISLQRSFAGGCHRCFVRDKQNNSLCYVQRRQHGVHRYCLEAGASQRVRLYSEVGDCITHMCDGTALVPTAAGVCFSNGSSISFRMSTSVSRTITLSHFSIPTTCNFVNTWGKRPVG